MEQVATPEDLADLHEKLATHFGQLSELVHETSELFGFTGLKTAVKPGEGWLTSFSNRGVTLQIDPLDSSKAFAQKDKSTVTLDDLLRALTETDINRATYSVCHELGHIRDYFEEGHDGETQEAPTDPAESFFWNIIDDAGIDKKLRNIPKFDDIIEAEFADRIPQDDWKGTPRHSQFASAILVRSVLKREDSMDDDVRAAVSGLENMQINGETLNVLEILVGQQTTHAERHEIAERLILPIYKEFLARDFIDFPNVDFTEYYKLMYSQPCFHYGDSSDSNDELETSPWHAFADLKDALANQQNKQDNAKQLGSMALLEGLNISKGESAAYLEMLQEDRAIIQEVASILETLGVPSPSLVAPRYRKHPSYSGRRLHPKRLAQAVIYGEQADEQQIWQDIELANKRVDFELATLDIHLVCDVSGSMGGQSSKIASEAALILMEAIELAKQRVALRGIDEDPDVRIQVIAFGSGRAVIAEIGNELSLPNKGKTFTALRNPNGGTQLYPAIKTIRESVADKPDRFQLIFVLSDGGYHDYDNARAELLRFDQDKVHVADIITDKNYPRDYVLGDLLVLEDPKKLALNLHQQLGSFVTKIRE